LLRNHQPSALGHPHAGRDYVQLAKPWRDGILPGMTDWQADPAKLRAVQEEIYRERVLRARAMTVAERLMSGFECTRLSLSFMYGGVQAQRRGLSAEETWAEVGARIDRGRRLHDHGFYRKEAASHG